MNGKELRIRCSSLGKIMTNPRSKSQTLSETCKTYIKELYLENELNIKKEFWSRYTDKGTIVEKESIALANDVLGWGLSFSEINRDDQPFIENEFIHGHTDVCNENILADTKSSWDGTTFPFFAQDIPNKDYKWQLMGYMWLTGHTQAHLTYCLIDTPEDMVQDEIRREHWKQNSFWQGDEDDAIVEYVKAKHTFSHMDKKLRVKNFVIERDEKLIESIKNRVLECREYYEHLKTIIN